MNVLDNVTMLSDSTGSPFTFTLDSGSSTPEVGLQACFYISQSSDANVYALVNATVTSSTILTIDAVLNSSSADNKELPAFSGGVLILSAFPTTFMNEANSGGFDIIPEIGQSNMMTFIPDTFDANLYSDSNTDVFALDAAYDQKIIPSTAGPRFPGNGISSPAGVIGALFAKRYSQSIGGTRRILRVTAAVGGHGFGNNFWTSTGTDFIRTVNAVNAILAAYPNSRVVHILWQPGEFEALSGGTQAAQTAFYETLATDMRAAFNSSGLMTAQDKARIPITMGGMVPDWVAGDVARQPVQDANEAVGATIAHCAYADSTGAAAHTDVIHFSVAGSEFMANRHWLARPVAIANTLAPTAPGGFGVISGTPAATSIALDWPNVTGVPVPTYTVERRQGAGGYTTLATGVVSSEYNDTGPLTNSTEYTYRITATNGVGSDSVSAETPFTTTAGNVAPGPFGTISGTPSQTSVDLSWSAVTGIPTPTYTVSRRTGGGGYSPVVTGLTSPAYNDTGPLTPGTLYTYQITATNGESPDSLSAETPFTTLAATSIAWAQFENNNGITTGATFTWADQSGNNRHATQTTAGNQPTDNGAAGITFDGDDWLEITGGAQSGSGYTRIVRFNVPSTAQGTLIGNANNILWVAGNQKVAAGVNGDFVAVEDPSVVATGSVQTYAVTHAPGGLLTLYNVTTGTAVQVDQASTTPQNDSGNTLIGAYTTGSLFGATASILDVRLYDSPLTTTEIESEVADM